MAIYRFSDEMQKKHQEHLTLFEATLEKMANEAGWSYDISSLSRQEGSWLASNTHFVKPFSGVMVNWTYKPAAFDPLFWEIVRSDENDILPLSRSDNLACLFHPLVQGAILSKDEVNPERLAHNVFAWSQERLEESKDISLEQMLGKLGQLEITSGAKRSIAVCLLILLDRLDEALDLCTTKYDSRSLAAIRAGQPDCDQGIFLDCAQAWLLRQ